MRAERDHLNRKLRCLLHCGLHQRTIEVTCPACGNLVKFDAVPLWWHFEKRGIDDALPDVMRRLHCAACRRAGRLVRPRWRITEDPPQATALPYPDGREWKRQISRYLPPARLLKQFFRTSQIPIASAMRFKARLKPPAAHEQS